MDPQKFIQQALSQTGITIDEERARILGSSEGLYPVLTMLMSGLREIDVESYEPLDTPDFYHRVKP